MSDLTPAERKAMKTAHKAAIKRAENGERRPSIFDEGWLAARNYYTKPRVAESPDLEDRGDREVGRLLMRSERAEERIRVLEEALRRAAVYVQPGSPNTERLIGEINRALSGSVSDV